MLLNKPKSMRVREWLIKTLSLRENISQNVITAVVAHQYDEASTAMNDNNSIEISGFGKFYYNKGRADKEMEKLLSKQKALQMLLEEEISERRKHATLRKLDTVEKNIELLKTKL